MIDEKTVARIAKLARIEVNAEDTAHFTTEISGIMQWIEQLKEVDTDNVPVLNSVADMQLRWRKDEVTDGSQQEKVLANAPSSDHGCFAVPKVIE